MQRKLALLKEAVDRLRRGDIRSILQYAAATAESYFGPGIRVRSTDVRSTPLQSDGELARAQVKEHGATSFYTITESDAIRINPGYSFNWFAIDLVGMEGVDATTVDVTFYGSDGQAVDEASTTFTDGLFYDRSVITLEFSTDEKVPRASVEVQRNSGESRQSFGEKWHRFNGRRPTLAEPHCGNGDEGTPIFLVSIDSLRYDYMSYLNQTRQRLGADGQVPSEPRAQAPATAPSHASLFTGVYPGEHGCQQSPHHLNEDLTTIAELLREEGYLCSACYGNYYLSPDTGLSRGFHRSKFNPMDWQSRQFDAKKNVTDVVEWLQRDLETNPHRLFYFLHIQDTHYPYFPPQKGPNVGELDYPSMERLIDEYHAQREQTYVTAARDRPSVDLDDAKLAKRYYRETVKYVDRQLARLFDALKAFDMFNESLIIVVGDHGEEFGDDGFLFHWTLHDEVIRPAMMVKPPKDGSFNVPDTADFIDVVPTVADVVGADVPPEVRGQSWKQERESRPRVSEEFATPEYYNVSVEDGKRKVLLSYDDSNGARPQGDQLSKGPVFRHSLDVSKLRDGESRWGDASIPDAKTNDLVEIATEFVESGDSTPRTATSKIPDDVNQRLQELGYVD